jgi:hypothetical protein
MRFYFDRNLSSWKKLTWLEKMIGFQQKNGAKSARMLMVLLRKNSLLPVNLTSSDKGS